MIVGIDVHKRTHVAALLDERGGELGTLDFANSPEGMRRRSPIHESVAQLDPQRGHTSDSDTVEPFASTSARTPHATHRRMSSGETPARDGERDVPPPARNLRT